jgi:uncharacterized protein
MSMTHLSTGQLRDAILSGCQYLVNQCSNLNRINVFPVADGDTGDNMSSAASAILTFSAEKSCIPETLKSIADASVMGARGNSGIIFSQFFNALADGVSQKDKIDIHHFSHLLKHAAANVRAAIASPAEGTILTVMDAWAKSFKKQLTESVLFNDVMTAVLPSLKKTVESTPDLLIELKKANVVDAGALGFYHFVNGFSDSLNRLDRPTYDAALPENTHIDHVFPSVDVPPIRRYCTEAVLNAEKIDKAQLLTILEEHGDSVALTGNDRLCRFHLHTNHPSALFGRLMTHGTIQYPKMDDMLRQFQSIHQRQHEIALVTDSSADIPLEWQDKYQIHQLTLNMNLDDNHCLDRLFFEPKEFYQSLSQVNKPPKTSCPSPALIKEKLGYLSQHYKHVLVLSLSKMMSGMYDAVTQAALDFSNVTVIDSRTTSGAQGLLLDYAGQLIAANEPFESVVKAIRLAITQTPVFIMVDQLDLMIQSGRVSKLKGRFAQFARMKPIVTINDEGKAVVHGSAFQARRALNKMIAAIQKQMRQSGKTLAQYCIVHAGAEEQAIAFSKVTTRAFRQAPAYIEFASSVIGVHAGVGCVALAVRMSH